MFSVIESVNILKKSIKNFPSTLFILGSGWNKVLNDVEVQTEIEYEKLFGVKSTVPGHAGKLVIGKLEDKLVALMVGRFHTYEGYSTEEVTRPIQVFAQLGLKRVVITSAAGALNEKYRVGQFVILSDVITMLCPSPLTGPQFVDLSEVFDSRLRLRAKQICVRSEIPFREGTYCYVRGPHFETPADKMMLHHFGADVVGMSTVPETIMARSLDIEVLGISFVTNLAFAKHDHHDVLAAAEKGSQQMVELLRGIVG